MKNFMVIDGAGDSTHDVFTVDNATFELVFPGGTDVAFLDEVVKRVRRRGLKQTAFFGKLYARQADKKTLRGLHGILHSTGSYCDPRCFPTRKESEAVSILKTGRHT